MFPGHLKTSKGFLVFSITLKILFMCMHACLHKFMYTMYMHVQVPEGIRKDSPGSGVEGCCELPNVGAEN